MDSSLRFPMLFDGFYHGVVWSAKIPTAISEAQESLPPPRRSMVYNVMVESQPASPKASKKVRHGMPWDTMNEDLWNLVIIRWFDVTWYTY